MTSTKSKKLQRTTFRTSRMLDFCSRKELTAQTGHPPEAWPLVIVKELVDNAVDATEDAGIAPKIQISVDDTGITIADNGPGIAPEVIGDILDFAVRVSSREAYISPTRGAQGNALKTIIAMPFVLDGESGRVEIGSQGVRHSITMSVDRIKQQPVVDRQEHQDRFVKNGTFVKVHFPDSACSILELAKERFLQIADDFTFVNPHLSLEIDWSGERRKIKATTTLWKKWLPSNPTSAHWYGIEQFERLVAGYIAHDAEHEADRTVRELVAEFDGLTGTAKQKSILHATGLARQSLSVLRNGQGLRRELLERLLATMKEQTRPIKPQALGIIGKDHLAKRFAGLGAKMETFKYRKDTGVIDSLPWVIETAFAWCPDLGERRLITGVNWSPGISNPFRELGDYGKSLDSILEQQRAGADEPIVTFLHLACPRIEYTDRGKSAVVIRSSAEEE